MPDPSRDPGTPSGAEGTRTAGGFALPGVLATLARDLVSLFAGKLRLAELELSRDLAGLSTTAILLAAVAFLLLFTLLFAGAGAAFLLGEAIGSTGLGLLSVAGIYLLAALVLFLAGRKRLRRLRHVLAESRADLKRDMEWLRSLQ